MQARVLTPEDSEYPFRLKEAPFPPAELHVRGSIPRGPLVAIVGTRKPTPEAALFASALAADLARAGVSICSGGAFGIDTAAHRGCMEGGAPTLVVSPAGLERPYPRENEDLFAEIAERGGAVISTYPPCTRAAYATFFERNAVLATLSHVLVVVESAFRGGARNAAKAARDAGRPVLVVPGAPWNPRATGCLIEIRNGAPLITSYRDVLRRLPEPFASRASGKSVASPPSSGLCRPAGRILSGRPPAAPDPTLDPDGHVIVSAIESGAQHVEAVCCSTGLPAARVQATLLTLTLQGILVSDPSGRLSLVTR